jgi:hypothetical protein
MLLARLPAPLNAAEPRAMLGEPVEEHRFVADRINYGGESK